MILYHQQVRSPFGVPFRQVLTSPFPRAGGWKGPPVAAEAWPLPGEATKTGCGRELCAITVETYTNIIKHIHIYIYIYTSLSYSVLLYDVMLFYVIVHIKFYYMMLYFVMLCFIILKFN